MSTSLNVMEDVALLLVAALIAGKIVKAMKLPNVTGYLVMGILIGPHCLNLLESDTVLGMQFVSDAALGFIAFSIGAEFSISYLKKVGKSPVIIAVLEGFTATILLDIVLLLLGYDYHLAMALGAIASATAAASTLMICKQYKAKGPVTNTLLPVVAMDDAVALVAFGLSMAVIKVIDSGQFSIKAVSMPLLEIVEALALGFVLGLVLTQLVKFYTGRGNRLALTISFVFICCGVCAQLGLSSLLACMMMSAVFANTSKFTEKIFEPLDRMTPPIYMMFFIISGASLDITIIPKIGVVGVCYVVVRVIGKFCGAYLGAVLSKAPPVVKKYLGLALVPQEGVAIGLVTVAKQQFPEYGDTIQTVVLCGIVIYELVGPLISKMTLKAAGELDLSVDQKKKK